MRKRIIGSLLILVFFVSVLCVSVAAAADTTQIEFGEVYGKAGEQVEVPVTITGNPGIAGFRFWVEYDMDALTLVSVEKGEALASGTLKFNVDEEDATITWFALTDVTGNGEIMTLTFAVSEHATGNYPLTVTYDPEDIVNASWQKVNCAVTDGSIKVEDLKGLQYAVENNQVTITGYTGNGGDLVIPDTIEGLPVTGIGDSAFDSCDNLTNVYYCGTQEQWNAISVGANNSALTEATLQLHNYQNGVCTICGEKAVYTVIFKDWNGDVLSTNTYHWGDEIVIPQAPTRPDEGLSVYTFTGWDKEVATTCTGNATYTATYSVVQKRTGWVLEGETWYYFDENGEMMKGWQLIGGTWYFMDASGAMQTGWQFIGDVWYYFYSGGAMVTGDVIIDGAMSSFAPSGAWLGYAAAGWKWANGSWYYLADGGVVQTGWQLVYGTWYYMDASGAMVTGWQLIGDVWYYFYSGGAMVTGDVIIDGAMSSFASSGAWLGYAASGWKWANGSWYYLADGGVVQTGWQLVYGTWYYMDASGAMQTGWQLVYGTWYYMDASGAMVTGWLDLGGTWYYLTAGGAMATDWQYIDGVWYNFNSSGVWIG